MNSTFAMSQGAGQKLEFAFQRNDGTTSDLDWLSAGENLKSVILLARGEAELIIKIKPASKPRTNLLELVSTVEVPATTSKFVAKDKFVVNTKRNAPVKISAVWDNFTTWFLSGKGKTEDPISEQTLRYHKLRQSSVDGPIITEFGGEAKAETTLSEMFSIMAKQPNGEDGTLLNNGWANIFYIKDQNGVLRAVDVHWAGLGWGVDAYSVEGPDAWRDGFQVFSRNSALTSSGTSVSAKA